LTGFLFERTNELNELSHPNKSDAAYAKFRKACGSFNAAIDAPATFLRGVRIPDSTPNAVMHDAFIDDVTDPDGKLFATAAKLIGPLETAPKASEADRNNLSILAVAAVSGLCRKAMDLRPDEAARLVILTVPAIAAFLNENHIPLSGGDLQWLGAVGVKVQSVSQKAAEATRLLFHSTAVDLVVPKVTRAHVPNVEKDRLLEEAFGQARSTGSEYLRMKALAAGGFSTPEQLERKYSDFRTACRSAYAADTPDAVKKRDAFLDRVDRGRDADARFFATAVKLVGPLENAPGATDSEHRKSLGKLATRALEDLRHEVMSRSNEDAAALVILTAPALMAFLDENHIVWNSKEGFSLVKFIQSKIGGFSQNADEAIKLLFSGIDPGPQAAP
jgi:hypothetical protein